MFVRWGAVDRSVVYVICFMCVRVFIGFLVLHDWHFFWKLSTCVVCVENPWLC